MQPTGLEGKVALVTGGGSGLGQAICHSLAEAGMVVAVADIREEQAQRVANDLQAQDRQVMPLQVDVADEKSAQAAIDNVTSACGRLDVLVNCAGIDLTVPVEEMPVEQWNRILGVNLTGPFIMSKIALPKMKERGEGHIINIVSTAAKRAWANASVYHASKWGLLGFTYALHVEGRTHGVKVTAVIAGGMRTPFLLDRFPDIDVTKLQDPKNVADAVRYALTLPKETVIPEVMVLPMGETSWP